MSTEKSIKIQKNKVLTYSVNKSGFKTVYGSTVVSENQTINVEMKNLNSETGAFQLGDRLFGISSFVDYFTPSGEYDVDSLKYISASQTTGTGLTNIAVVKETWLSKVETSLGIETPKGTSNNFIFTYNGSTWDITGALTLASQSLEDFGISFEGTATNGDVITVVETQYNKFAFFVLDANYRSNSFWCDTSVTNVKILPTQYYNRAMDCGESATWCNEYIYNNANISLYTVFNDCKNLGNFLLNTDIKLNALIPNTIELKKIWDNRVILDNIDPIIQSGTTSFNLTNWDFYDYRGTRDAYTCIDMTIGNNDNCSVINQSGQESLLGKHPNTYQEGGVVPIFEVPVM